MQPIVREGKTFAPLSALRPWPKNPKFIKEENLEKLKNHILELQVYKPLLVTEDGEILGGNQRFKALSELEKEHPGTFTEVWVSVVDAWTDEARLKYALSDNLSLGTYKEDELMELVKPFADQPALFKDYDIEIGDVKSLKQFTEDFILGVDELRIRNLEKQLKEAGINDETIAVIKDMSSFNKQNSRIADVDLKGECTKTEKYPLTFWFTSKEDWQKMFDLYTVNGGMKLDEQRLIDRSKV